MNTKDLSLIYLQMQMEYYFDNYGYIIHKPDCTSKARLVVYKTIDGSICFFNKSININTINRLSNMPVDILLNNQKEIYNIIGIINNKSIWHGYSYIFTSIPEYNNELINFKNDKFIIEDKNGNILSKAWSARESVFAAEPIVDTLIDQQKKGYGKKVISAWAEYQINKNRVAFYSHLIDNNASASLAAKLPLYKFAEIIAYN